jgi:hypothetical protein
MTSAQRLSFASVSSKRWIQQIFSLYQLKSTGNSKREQSAPRHAPAAAGTENKWQRSNFSIPLAARSKPSLL